MAEAARAPVHTGPRGAFGSGLKTLAALWSAGVVTCLVWLVSALESRWAWPSHIQHDEYSQASQNYELVVNEVWNHSVAPLHGGGTEPCSRIVGPAE